MFFKKKSKEGLEKAEELGLITKKEALILEIKRAEKKLKRLEKKEVKRTPRRGVR